MTEEEYLTRGMLLGFEYSGLIQAYVDKSSTVEVWLDRDTLEQISADDKFNRLMSSIAKGTDYGRQAHP